jgi:hypothetical protein
MKVLRLFYLYVLYLAESQGFEPWKPFWSLHTFQACAFDHSANSPDYFNFRVSLKLISIFF